MDWYIIPARRGSKGLPFKNRKLFEYTINSIPASLRENVIVTTDDEKIQARAQEYELIVRNRPEELSGDAVSIKCVLEDVIDYYKLLPEDNLILLYLTYPERELKDITAAIAFFNDKKASSLLCKKELKVSPYLCCFEVGGIKGKKIINHDLYRRQDYLECFEMSHFIAIVKVNFLKKVVTNLFSSDTIFMPINNVIDVDLPTDLKEFLND